jgi:hypothetical protein
MGCMNTLVAHQILARRVGLVKCSFFRAEAIAQPAFRKWTLASALRVIVCVKAKKSFVNRMNVIVVAVNVSRTGMYMKRGCGKDKRGKRDKKDRESNIKIGSIFQSSFEKIEAI